jgi:hypothetical protein
LERERISDWAEKKWNLIGTFYSLLLNGVDWDKSAVVPQNSIIDVVVQWKSDTPSEDTPIELQVASYQIPVFVELIDRTHVWKLSRGFEWSSFEARAKELLGDTKWHATFHGEIWKDDSRIPEPKTHIKIEVHMDGGEPPRRIPATHARSSSRS